MHISYDQSLSHIIATHNTFYGCANNHVHQLLATTYDDFL